MSDDLTEFFAKKKEKSKEKKKKGVNIEDVGMQLERKARRQEARDREDEEDEKRLADEENFLKGKTAEDSEWLDYTVEGREMRLTDLGIRDMNVTEQGEDQGEEEKVTPQEPTRTWNMNTDGKGDEPSEEVAAPAPVLKYVAPGAQAARRTWQTHATPDINNQEAFPTFAAAQEIEKHKRDAEKNKKTRKAPEPESTWTTQGGNRADRQEVMNAVRDITGGGGTISRGGASPAAATVQSPSAAPKPGVYVPPSRRGLANN